MEKQMRAERERREVILIAEGEKKSQVLIAEWDVKSHSGRPKLKSRRLSKRQKVSPRPS